MLIISVVEIGRILKMNEELFFYGGLSVLAVLIILAFIYVIYQEVKR